MLRVTRDVVEIRRWAELRGGQPCRDDATGRLAIAFGDDECLVPIGWDEFEPAFCGAGYVFVYDDTPGQLRIFLGPPDEAQLFASAPGDTGAGATT